MIALCRKASCSAARVLLASSRPARPFRRGARDARRIRAKNSLKVALAGSRYSGVGHWGAAGADRARRAPPTRQDQRRRLENADRVPPLRLQHAPTNGKFDGPTMEVVTAFQRRFRPERVDGIADQSTMAALRTAREPAAGDGSTGGRCRDPVKMPLQLVRRTLIVLTSPCSRRALFWRVCLF